MTALQQLAPVTLQEQLYQKLLEQIQNGTFQVGDKLPTELELCDMYQVSRVTVRKVLSRLVAEQHLTKTRGKGTFVKSHRFLDKIFSGGSFTDTCMRMNVTPSTKIITLETVKSPAIFAQKLGSSAIHLTRLRHVDGTPCIVEEDYFPSAYDFLLSEPLEEGSILRRIYENTNIFPSTFEDFFQISYADRKCASLLNCSVGHALLEVTQSVLASDDALIYINQQYILSERYTYAVRSGQ